MHRRTFLSLAGLTPFLGINASAMNESKNNKSCVFIFLSGGVSATEFINPIPTAPVEFRSVNGAVTTKSGYEIGGTFQNLAKLSNLYTTVRSLNHRDANHSSASAWIMTSFSHLGSAEGAAQKDPGYGAVVAKVFGDTNEIGLPNYVKTSKIHGDSSAWLGSKYTGYENNKEAVENLKLKISKEQWDRRLSIVNMIERDTVDPMAKQWTELRNTASKIIAGGAGKVFDWENDPAKTYYDADKNTFGRDLLLARRLVEAGTKFVTVQTGGFDNHGDIAQSFETRGVQLDLYLSKFLEDMNQRGLLKDTMVVVASEFSRTPKLNNGNLGTSNRPAGRDHWNAINSLLIAGAGYGGTLIGTTDNRASEVTSEPFSPFDLAYTIFNHFGIDKGDKTIDITNRPRYYIDNEARLIV